MTRHCAEHKRALYRQLYDVVFYGRVGGLDVARRMPTELRKFWLEQVVADREEQRKAEENARKGGGR